MAKVENYFCDLCDKKKEKEELNNSVMVEDNKLVERIFYLEVCDTCATKIKSLLNQIKNKE